MVAPLNITGERYGRLVAIRKTSFTGKFTTWLFHCDCGTAKEIKLDAVRSGRTRSCGCLQREDIASRSLKHGHTANYRASREHKSWSHARSRCTNPNDKKWPSYGARGIRMCDRWTDDFRAFLSDMGPAPIGTTLDRIDVDGHYEPGNCRWATPREQARNTRTNVWVEHDGERMILKDFAARLGINYKRLHQRMRQARLSANEAAAAILAQPHLRGRPPV